MIFDRNQFKTLLTFTVQIESLEARKMLLHKLFLSAFLPPPLFPKPSFTL